MLVGKRCWRILRSLNRRFLENNVFCQTSYFQIFWWIFANIYKTYKITVLVTYTPTLTTDTNSKLGYVTVSVRETVCLSISAVPMDACRQGLTYNVDLSVIALSRNVRTGLPTAAVWAETGSCTPCSFIKIQTAVGHFTPTTPPLSK